MPGDAVVRPILDINVTSLATASGHDRWVEGHYLGDAYAASRCPNCGTLYPDTYVEGIGQQAVHCVKCNTPVTPFQIVNGYTLVFDETRQVGVTVPRRLRNGLRMLPINLLLCRKVRLSIRSSRLSS